MQSALVLLRDRHHDPHKANSSTPAACRPSSLPAHNSHRPHPNPRQPTLLLRQVSYLRTTLNSNTSESRRIHLALCSTLLCPTKLLPFQELVTNYLREAKLSMPLLPKPEPSLIHSQTSRGGTEGRAPVCFRDQATEAPKIRITTTFAQTTPRYGQRLGRRYQASRPHSHCS